MSLYLSSPFTGYLVRPWVLYTKLRIDGYRMTEPVYHLFNRTLDSNLEYYTDTNMPLAGRLPTPQAFQVQSIHVVYDHYRRDQDAIDEFRSRYILTFLLMQRYMFQSPLNLMSPTIKLVEKPRPGMARTTPGYFPDDFPINIMEQMFFDVEMRGKPFLVPMMQKISLTVALNGVMRFGVQ